MAASCYVRIDVNIACGEPSGVEFQDTKAAAVDRDLGLRPTLYFCTKPTHTVFVLYCICLYIAIFFSIAVIPNVIFQKSLPPKLEYLLVLQCLFPWFVGFKCKVWKLVCWLGSLQKIDYFKSLIFTVLLLEPIWTSVWLSLSKPMGTAPRLRMGTFASVTGSLWTSQIKSLVRSADLWGGDYLKKNEVASCFDQTTELFPCSVFLILHRPASKHL